VNPGGENEKRDAAADDAARRRVSRSPRRQAASEASMTYATSSSRLSLAEPRPWIEYAVGDRDAFTP